MPPERVKAVVPGALSRLVYRLGIRPVRWKMLRALAIARLFWRIDWWRGKLEPGVEVSMEQMLRMHYDFVYFEIADEEAIRSRSGESLCQPPTLTAGRPEEFPGGYIAFGIDVLSLLFVQLVPETARSITLDWREEPLATYVENSAGERSSFEQPPPSHQRLMVELIHLLLDKRERLQEKLVTFAEDDEGGLACSVEGKEVRLKRSS